MFFQNLVVGILVLCSALYVLKTLAGKMQKNSGGGCGGCSGAGCGGVGRNPTGTGCGPQPLVFHPPLRKIKVN
jgi:uncharacterized membrane protein